MLVSNCLTSHPVPRRHGWTSQQPVCVRLPFSIWLQHSPHWLRQVDENVLTVALSPHFPPPLSHYLCVVQMEEVIARMQDEKNGIPIRTVKSFLTKIPSVFSGKSFIPLCCCAFLPLFSPLPLPLNLPLHPPSAQQAITLFLANKTRKVFRELSVFAFHTSRARMSRGSS